MRGLDAIEAIVATWAAEDIAHRDLTPAILAAVDRLLARGVVAINPAANPNHAIALRCHRLATGGVPL